MWKIVNVQKMEMTRRNDVSHTLYSTGVDKI